MPEKSIEIINARFLKPLDEKTLLKSIEKTKKVITIEDNLLKELENKYGLTAEKIAEA